MNAREEFEKWADGFDHEAREWLDMENDKVFEAGYKARQHQVDVLNAEANERIRLEEENAALKAEVTRLRKAAEELMNVLDATYIGSSAKAHIERLRAALEGK